MIRKLVEWWAKRRGLKLVANNLSLVYVPNRVAQIAKEAQSLVAQWDVVEGWSGEAKRHQVYARLLKRYPEMPHYALGLALELAVRNERESL